MDKLHIAICVPGLPFQGDTVENKSLGGSESAGFYLAREFARMDHEVLCFTNTERPGNYEGVSYQKISEFDSYKQMSPHDVTIVQRMPESFNVQCASKMNIVWCHDLALARRAGVARGCLWNIDKFAVLSKFMHDQYKETYSLRDEDLFLTGNGVDLDAFKNLDLLPRDPHKIMYVSRPERGLDLMLTKIFPKILEADKDYRLHLCGYDNQVDELAEFYAEIERLIAAFGDRVVWLGYLTKAELYQHYATAGAFTYPTPGETTRTFREIFCISAVEAQAAGCPVITSRNGALVETVGKGAGVLIDGEPWTTEYQEKFVEAVLKTRDPEISKAFGKAGRRKAKTYGWDKIAKDWLDEFERHINSRNDKPERLARWFYKRSDIEALKRVVEKHPIPSLQREINKHYRWFKDEESVQKHYRETVGPYYDAEFVEKITKHGEDTFAKLFEETREKRFGFFADHITRNRDIKRVVDYGCGHGWCDIWLHNAVGVEVTGIDVDPAAIKWSKFFTRHADDASMLNFICGDHTLEPDGEYDLLLISECLEHVWDPAAVVDAMERWVKPEGWVILTVPYGPMELADFKTLPFRNHVREFDHHDLNDLLGDKEPLIWTIAERHCEITGAACGYYVAVYQPNGQPCGEIDWERKLKWQRPQQTVSTCIIAGGPKIKECAHWCLDSIQDIADEIIVADTGLDEEGRRILDQHGVRYVPSQDPRQVGFDIPRNDSIATATQDWILWIDMDEHLVDSKNLFKYLRENQFFAYGIRQHHFSVDAGFPPDMPNRVFRNRKLDGKQPQFFGRIHEHPELGMNGGMGEIIILADANIAHVGYLSEPIRRLRFARNYPLVQKDCEDYPDRMLQKYFIMRDNSLLMMYEGQHTGGRVTSRIKELAAETRDLYREHFLGKPILLNVDPLQYYTQALKVLGEGIDVDFDIAARRNELGDQLNGGIQARFTNVEEAAMELTSRLKYKAEPLEHRWW